MKAIITFDELTKILNDKLEEMQTARTDEEHESNEAIILEAIEK